MIDLYEECSGVVEGRKVYPSGITDRELYDLMSTPEILPLQADNTITFWLKRIGTWGTLSIVYKDSNKRKHTLSDRQLAELLVNTNDPSRFSSWDFRKKGVTALQIVRQNFGDGKRGEEVVNIKIKLKPELKKYIRGW